IALFLVLGVLLYEYAAVRSIELPAKSDQLFSLVAVEGGLPTFVGVLFVLGLTASTFASSASSLTALTTSCTVDLLSGGAAERSEETITRQRYVVHSLIAIAIALLILVVGSLGNQSVINLLFKFVGYTYGPILGMFSFGMMTRWRVHDRGVWVVAVASLLLSVGGEWCVMHLWGYRVGFELLIYNAILTFVGLLVIRRGER
ncbi:MAG: sodium:solute symporter, partial [Rikenellaceae bacterium]